MFVLQYFYDNLTIDRPRRHSCARRSTSGCCSHFVIPAADALSVPIAIWPTISGLMYDAKPGQRTPEPSSRRFSDETQPRRQPQLKLSDTQCETLYTKSVPKALASTITRNHVSWRHRSGQRLGLLVIRRLTPGFRIAYDRTGLECNGLRRTVTGRRTARTRSALADRVFRPRAPRRF